MVLKDKADLSEESSGGAGRFGESQLGGQWSSESMAQEQIDAPVGTPGRLGRGSGDGEGWNFPFLPIPVDLQAEGRWQCLQWG